MWCTHCQQDIPAVARSEQGPLLCSQCENEVGEQTVLLDEASHPADSGVPLESFDARREAAEKAMAPPVDELERQQTSQRMRRLGRQLRSTPRRDLEVGISPALRGDWSGATLEATQPQIQATYLPVRSAESVAKRSSVSWMISLLIFVGVFSFGLGLGLLAWSAAFQLPQQWQWGLTATIVAEGALILGLTWMAARLWYNSRQINRQLDGVDRQLTEIQELTGSLAGSHMSSSQHFYSHFSPSASPHMLVANLRGQVDQLASRIQ
jgi:hypothetical protein